MPVPAQRYAPLDLLGSCVQADAGSALTHGPPRFCAWHHETEQRTHIACLLVFDFVPCPSCACAPLAAHPLRQSPTRACARMQVRISVEQGRSQLRRRVRRTCRRASGRCGPARWSLRTTRTMPCASGQPSWPLRRERTRCVAHHTCNTAAEAEAAGSAFLCFVGWGAVRQLFAHTATAGSSTCALNSTGQLVAQTNASPTLYSLSTWDGAG